MIKIMESRTGIRACLRLLAIWTLRAVIAAGAVVAIMSFAYRPLAVTASAMFAASETCCRSELFRMVRETDHFRKLAGEFVPNSRTERTDPQGYTLISTPGGNYWGPSKSAQVLPVIAAQQAADFYGLEFLGVRAGSVVIDCGAHVGIFARRALDAGAALVVAIEPSPQNLECLRRNLAKEISIGRVVVMPTGVWDREEMLPLYENESNTAGDSFVDKENRTIAVAAMKLTTIDRIVEDLKLAKVDVIKMDIKGATINALEGGRGTLARYHPRIAVATEEDADDPAEVTRKVRSLGLGYKTRCGFFSMDKGRVWPYVVTFY